MARKQVGSSPAAVPRPTAAERRALESTRVLTILAQLDREFPDANCALGHDSPFQLLVATILSAQCTDERVNRTTPALFARFPTAELLAGASQADVEQIVKPLGFFRAKAKNLREMAQALVERHGGEVPPTLEDLVRLPGVGRKTANVVLGVSFGIAEGVVVDTHVKRISKLLGLTHQTDPVKVEQDLISRLPREKWILFSHQLILHGRKTCVARRPKCAGCPLLSLCPQAGLAPLSSARTE
jgi:endonuclease-3